MSAVFLYVVLFIVVAPDWIPDGLRRRWVQPQSAIHAVIRDTAAWFGYPKLSVHLQFAIFFTITALTIPVTFTMLVLRRRPADIGWRKPNALYLRLVGCSFLVSLPFLFWMVSPRAFYDYYDQRYFQLTPVAGIAAYYLIVLFSEHLFFEGVMLGIFRKDGRWPAPATLCRETAHGMTAVLRWIGMAQPTVGAGGIRRVTRWLGIPDGCLGPILLSGLLFGFVHSGKNVRELYLSFPGGTFLAYLAYRCNSWHAPYLLHASTVLAAGAMMLLLHG